MTDQPLTKEQFATTAETFMAVAILIRTHLEEHIRSEEVGPQGPFVRDEGAHDFTLDGEFNLHALAGLLTRDLLKKFEVIEPGDLQQLLAVAALYVDAFEDDEMMSLPEKLRLQEVEAVLARHGAEPEKKEGHDGD